MRSRELVSLAALALTALAVGVGCPAEEKPAGSTGAASTAKATAGATTAKAAATATAAAKPAAATMGTATLKGVVNFTGTPLEMKSPVKRKDAEFCKTKDVKYNAVLVNNKKLQDVLVRISVNGVKGTFPAPTAHAEIDQTDCMYSPRIQGVVSGQEIDIKNADGTLHNVHTFKGTETWFNQAQPKGSATISKELGDEKVIKFTCDVHPWMHGFVVVTDHPFFAVTGADGSFTIPKVPAGKYTIEAWHSHYGLKKQDGVEIADGATKEVDFSFDGTEKEPAENTDELKGMW
jgi:plastocyanin